MAYENLPGVQESRLDGNLVIADTTTDPITMVLGTSAQGYSETVYQVRRLNDAKRIFGIDGTLVRGMYEASDGGAKNIRLFRIGATAAVLSNVGGGITIETIAKDNTAGDDYTIFWDDALGRLRVWRVSDDELVYDNNPAYPLLAIDLGLVAVTGAKVGSAGNIGTLSVPVTLTAANGVSGAVYTDGTDGTDLSRMETYEALYNAYQLLEDQNVDIVIPMNVYLDDANVMDLTASGVSALGLTALSDYPAMGSSTDVLGKVYVEEYEGENLFWWWFPANPASPSFSAAQIYPSGMLADTKADGVTALTAADFHEVNFAHQLATFCYDHSTYVIDVTGVIGAKPPASFAPRDVSNWIGKLPEYTEDLSTGNKIIDTNGTGLLGNKFMAGRKTASGLVGLAIDSIDGLFGGGFIATDDGFLDGDQQKDDNDKLIDIGQYISVVSAYTVQANPSRTGAYVASAAPFYAGYYSALAANMSPANQLVNTRLPFRVSPTKVNLLSGQKYVHFFSKPKGIVVADAPTAARVESDFRRLTTVRIVKAIVDDLRNTADPFLGKPLSEIRQQALDGALGDRLQERVKAEYLSRYQHTLSVTPAGRILGQAVLELVLVPVFELRKLFIVVSLSPV